MISVTVRRDSLIKYAYNIFDVSIDKIGVTYQQLNDRSDVLTIIIVDLAFIIVLTIINPYFSFTSWR